MKAKLAAVVTIGCVGVFGCSGQSDEQGAEEQEGALSAHLAAAFSANPVASVVGQVATFDASASTCNVAPCSYSWADGKSALGTGKVLNFTFHYVGTKHVALTVRNASGATATVEHDHTVTSTAPTPPPPPPPPPGGTPPLYDGTSGLAAGKIPFGYQSFIAGHVTVVPDPLGVMGNVMRYSIADSDRPYSGASNPRGDFETSGYFSDGADLYFSDRFLLPNGFPALVGCGRGSGWFQINEVYGPPHGGSPPMGFGLGCKNDSLTHVVLARGQQYNYDVPWIGPVVADDKWHTLVVHTKMSTNPSIGFAEIWLDGARQTFANGSTTLFYATLDSGVNWDGHTANVLNVNSYRKAGAYPGTVTLYHGAAKIGTTLASVE